jgi:hypothetical protein
MSSMLKQERTGEIGVRMQRSKKLARNELTKPQVLPLKISEQISIKK